MARSFLIVVMFSFAAGLVACDPATDTTPVSPSPDATVSPTPDTTVSPTPTTSP